MSATPAPNLVKNAVQYSKPLSKQGILEKLFTFWFSGFVYNQIWEDPRVDLEALQPDSTSRFLTISSGGCNVLNYLVHKPESISAVDLNRNHMSLTRLKLVALKHLPSYEDFFLFFAHGDDKKNLYNYHKFIAPHLDEVSREFWEGGSWLRRGLRRHRIKYFAKGFYNRSKLGMFLRTTHAIGKVTRRDPARLFEAKTIEEQEKIFEEVFGPLFDNKVIRFGTELPISVFSLGIPPSQYKIMKEESKGKLMDLYRERVKRLAAGFPLDDNYFAWQGFGRKYDLANRKALPDYLKEENYQTLKDNLHRVNTHIITLTQFMKSQPPQSLDRFVFLDSQDWMPPHVIDEMWTEISRVGKPGSRIIFRTSGEISPIEKSLNPTLMAKFKCEKELAAELFKKDRSAIYGGFHLYVMK